MRIVSGKIIGLDLATAAGFAIGEPGGEPRFGTHLLPSTGEDVGAFGVAFEDWLSPLIKAERPEVVLYEAPSMFAKSTPATVIKLNGLAYDAEKICKRLGVRCFKVNPSKLKKFFTGRGNAKKPDMVATAKRYGWRVLDDNAADACAVWAWGVFCFAAPEHRKRFELGPIGAEAAHVG